MNKEEKLGIIFDELAILPCQDRHKSLHDIFSRLSGKGRRQIKSAVFKQQSQPVQNVITTTGIKRIFVGKTVLLGRAGPFFGYVQTFRVIKALP